MYAYAANNPTTWVDPSGHFVGALGFAGLFMLLFLFLAFLLAYLQYLLWLQSGGADDLIDTLDGIPDTIDDLLDNFDDPPADNPDDNPAPTPLPPPVYIPTPDEDPKCAPDTDYLIRRATEINNILLPDEIAEEKQTVAVLRVRHYSGICTDIIGAGGEKNLTSDQRLAVQNWPIEDRATMTRAHAEVTVLEARRRGFESLPLIYKEPVAIGTSKPFCPTCRIYLSTYVSKSKGSMPKVVPNVKTKNQQKQEPKAPSVSIGVVSTKDVRGPAAGGVENGGNCGSLQLSPFSTPLDR